MKMFLASFIITILLGSGALADKIKLGILLGFTGPIESLTPNMATSAEIAWKEISDSGQLLGGKKIVAIRSDSTCVDASAATAAAERLITSEKVVAMVGADCSGVTAAVANNVAVPNGVVMISSSATSPALSSIDDKGYFFRTVPSDSRQGKILAGIVIDRGIKNVAITYTNNDYGKGLANSFSIAFKKKGGTIAITAAHEDGKADYSAEVAALAASGADDLVVFGYLDQGGKGIIRASLDLDAYSRFILTDGMIGQSILDDIGDGMTGSFGTMPGSDSDGAAVFANLLKKNNIESIGPFVGESYDAAAIIALAIQAAGSMDRAALQAKIMDVANTPGEKIYPGELAKALKILSKGGNINYEGATNVEFDEVGEVFGSYRELEVKDNRFETMKIH